MLLLIVYYGLMNHPSFNHTIKRKIDQGIGKIIEKRI
jgi:hypothetical protein